MYNCVEADFLLCLHFLHDVHQFPDPNYLENDRDCWAPREELSQHLTSLYEVPHVVLHKSSYLQSKTTAQVVQCGVFGNPLLECTRLWLQCSPWCVIAVFNRRS